jgi:hypothetical protein
VGPLSGFLEIGQLFTKKGELEIAKVQKSDNFFKCRPEAVFEITSLKVNFFCGTLLSFLPPQSSL